MKWQICSKLRGSLLNRLHQGLAEGCQQPGEGNRSAILGPGFAVHFDPKLAVAGKRNPHKLNFEVFVPAKILDRNTQIRFHNAMLTAMVIKINRARACAWSLA